MMEGWVAQREVDRQVRALVARACVEYGLADGCNGETACARIDLHLSTGPLPIGNDGLLADRHIVVSDRVTWPPRREFTVFHEIVHYLLDEDGELIEHFTAMYRKDAAAYQQELERCCNLGAAEFLLPQERVYEVIRREGFKVALVDHLASQHGASIVAAAQQLALCAPADSYVVLACDGNAPWVPRPYDGLCVEYGFMSPDTRYPLARYSPLPDDHLFTVAWRDQRALTRHTYIPFRSGRRKPCYGEAHPIDNRIIGFLSPHRPT